jgi:tRNA A-37 threonylcarbamoyl transferase component Bud32/tetratricopeptide (TPR) repeat protein
MGDVYRAHDTRLEREVALKLVRPGVHRDQTLREAQTLAKLAHPNVVRVYDAGEEADELYLAMELVDGPTLREWFAAADRPVPVILDVFEAAARGLAAAHAVGIVHRDFKPDNVLVGEDGRVHVIDFGLAEAGDMEHEATQEDLPGVTTVDSTVEGTPAYLAPERYRGLPATPESDQFAFCVSLYEALFGVRPFLGHSSTEIGLEMQRAAITFPSARRRVPRRIRELLRRGLQRAPGDRHASMLSLAASLARARRSRRPSFVLAGVAVAIGVGAGLVLAPSGDGGACLEAAAAVEDVYDEARRREIASAFDRSEKPFAATTRDTTLRRLDVFAHEWSEAWRATCEPSGLEGMRIEEGRSCLGGQREFFTGVVEGLVGGTASTGHGVEVGFSLPDPATCVREEGVGPVRRPALERERGVFSTLAAAQRFEDLDRETRDALARAEVENDGERRALASLYAGIAAKVVGDSDDARNLLTQASVLALSHERDDLAFWAWRELTWLEGFHRRDLARGLEMAEYARAALERGGLGVREEVALEVVLAWVGEHNGAVAVGAEHADRARELALPNLAADDPLLAEVYNAHGALAALHGRLPEAKEAYARAIEVRESSGGPADPWTAIPLHNLGALERVTGEPRRALELHRRAARVGTAAYGSDSAFAAVGHMNEGLALLELGDYASARFSLERAVTLLDSMHDAPQYPVATANLARVLVRGGESARAREYLRMAASALEIDSNPQRVRQHLELAKLELELGRARAARDRARSAEERMRAAFGDDYPAVWDALVLGAEASLALGDSSQARASASRALELARGRNPATEARARLVLTRSANPKKNEDDREVP